MGVCEHKFVLALVAKMAAVRICSRHWLGEFRLMEDVSSLSEDPKRLEG